MPEGFHIASAWISVKPDLSGFAEELKAKLDAATSGTSADARVGVNQGYLDASLAIAKAKLDALTAQTRNINIGTDGTGAAAAAAGATAARGWYGPYGIIGALRAANTAKLQLFGGAFGTTTMIGAIGGLHLLVDGIAEFVAVVVPATIAAGAWGVAASDAFRQVYTQVSNMHTVMDATTQSMYPFTGALEKLHQAVQPTVFQLAGDAIEVMAHNTGAFAKIVQGMDPVIQQLGARLTVALSSGGWHVFIANAVTDFAKLSDIVANLGGVFGNFLRAIPGYAQTLLSIADGISKVTESVSGLLVHPLPGLQQGLLGAGLAFHGFAIYAGLAVTAVSRVVPGILNGLSSLALKGAVAADSSKLLGAAGDRAAAGLLGFGGAAESAAALPWGWITLAAAGFGFLAYKILTAKDATQQWAASLEQAIGKSSAGAGLTPIIDAQAQVTTRLAAAQRTLADAGTNAGNVQRSLAQNMGRGNQALAQQATTVSDLTGPQQQLSANTELYKQRVLELAQAHHTTTAAMEGLLRVAGIPMSQFLSHNAEQWAQVQAAITATIDAYGLMGVKSGMLGSDVKTMNFLVSDQFKAVTQLNQAWDQMAQIVTGSQTSFDSWALAMKGLNIAAQGAGNALSVTNGKTSESIHGASQSTTAINNQAVSFDGLNKASLQYNQTLENTIPQMVSILDNIRLANLGTGTYTTAVKDLVTQYLPYVQNNKTLLGQLVELSGGAIPNSVTSYQQLVQWLGNSSDSSQTLHDKQQQLKQIMDEATNKTDGLTAAFQQQAQMITTQLLGDQDQVALKYFQIQQKVEAATQAQLQYGKSSQQAQSAENSLTSSIIAMGEKMDWGTTRTARMISELEHIPLKEAIQIVMHGDGSYNIVNSSLVSTGTGRFVHRPTGKAYGGFVSGPGGPETDSIPAWLSDGEYVVRAASVNKYGQGFLDAINAGAYASGGIVDGNAAVVSGQYANTIVSAFQNAMVKSMVDAMRSSINSAKSAGIGGFPGSGGASGPGAAAAQAYARSILGLYGWGAGQFPPLQALWNRESGWRWNATNPTSGAYGIPQSLPASKMAAAGADWRTNPATQIRWGLGYIRSTYGSPAGAEAHEQAVGWYRRGGPVRRASGGPVTQPAVQAGEFCSIAEHGKTRNGLICKKGPDGRFRWEHPSGSSSGGHGGGHGGGSSRPSASSEHTAGASLMNFYLSPHTAAAIAKEQTKFLEDIAQYYTGSARRWRDAMVTAQTRHLESVDSKLSKLNSQIQAAKSFQSGIQSGLASYAGLSGLDAFGNLMVPGVKPGQSVGQGLESQLKLKLSNLRKWQSDIKALQRAKVSPALISQVAQMDPDTGMQYAEAILAGGHSLIREMNATEASIGAIEKSTAKTATRAVYGKSISAMWEDEHELKKAAQFFGRELAKEAAKWFRVPRNQQPPAVLHFHGQRPTTEEKHQIMRELALVLGG
jgi:hypothetical protein